MAVVLVTGSSGLVGSECVRHFAALGHSVHGLDGNQRKNYFGEDGNTDMCRRRLEADVPRFRHHKGDIRDRASVFALIESVQPAAVLHCAAQPSHDLASSRPFDDWETNATGTLNLLEACRRLAPEAVFCFASTNKVYGDLPNVLRLAEMQTRYVFADEDYAHGVNELMALDGCIHSLFGCSKLAADVLVQEYGRNFGLQTGVFRCGCLTGSAHAGVEQHGFLSYLVRCCQQERTYRIWGHKGKQVRDQLHAADVACAFACFARRPRAGEVYNLGGGLDNSVSVIEAIDCIQSACGKTLATEYHETPRRGDHVVYYSDTRKFQGHYPAWQVTRSLAQIMEELCRPC